MDIQGVFKTAIEIVKTPKDFIKKWSAKPTPAMDLIKNYVLILAFIPAIAMFIGYAFVGLNFGFFSYKFPIEAALIISIVQLVTTVAGVYVGGYVINFLASNFKSKQNLDKSVNLVALGATPSLLAGVFYVYPSLSIFAALAGLYGLYILYQGLPVFMETPKKQQMTYFIVALVAMIVVSFVIGIVVGAITAPFYAQAFTGMGMGQLGMNSGGFNYPY